MTEAQTKLEQSVKTIQNLLIKRLRIKASIERADENLVAAQGSRGDLEMEVASALAEEAIAPEKSIARELLDRFTRNREEAELARLSRSGLERTLEQTEAQIRDAIREFEVARGERNAEVIANFDSEYKRAVNAVLAVLRKGVALGAAIREADLQRACEISTLYDVRSLENLNTAAKDWESDPKAKAVFEANKGVLDFAQAVRHAEMVDVKEPAWAQMVEQMEQAILAA